MFDLNLKIRESSVSFENIQLNSAWSLKYLGIAKFQIALVKILMTITTDNGQPVLNISGEIWANGQKIMAGQICEALMETNLIYDHRFVRIAEIWIKYHMNNIQFGTAGQINMLFYALAHKEIKLSDWRNIPVCFDYLYKRGMADDNGIVYGGGVKYLPIPSSVLNELDTMFPGTNCA